MKRLVTGLFVVAACLSAVYFMTVSSESLRSFEHPQFLHFNQWQIEFEKIYESEMELMMRFGVWLVNDALIQGVNSQKLNYTFGHNQFSDLTEKERSSRMSCAYAVPDDVEKTPLSEDLPDENLQANVDWVKKGYVTPVQNQGGCGSCWAFAAVAAMEGAYVAKTGKLLKFSEQQLVDCEPKSGGCDGGWIYTSFNYYKNHGIETLQCYPYTAKNGRCKSGCKGMGKSTGHVWVNKGEKYLSASINKRVTGVSIHSGPISFYKGGIFNGNCAAKNLDHCVTAVGHDAQSFHVKNSWGKGWGENGYIRFAKQGQNSNGLCGIAKDAVYTTM